MRLIGPNYSYKRDPYCQYCGSRRVVWEKRVEKGKPVKWTLIDMDTQQPHYKTCTSRRESVNSRKPL